MVEPMISQMETQNYRTEPGKFEYFLVDGLKLPPTIIKPTFDALYNTDQYLKSLQEYNKQTPPLPNQITQSIKNLAKKISNITKHQKGTSKGGVKWKTSPRPDYIYNGKPVYPPTKYSPERGNAEKHYLIDPYSGTLLDSGESNLMNDLEDTRYPMGGYDVSYELAKDYDTNSEKYRKNPILVSGFVSDLIGNRGFGRRIGTSWGNAYPHIPGWIKKPLFKKGYYKRY